MGLCVSVNIVNIAICIVSIFLPVQVGFHEENKAQTEIRHTREVQIECEHTVHPTPPEITSSMVVTEGVASSLTCESTNGCPIPKLYWVFRGTEYHRTTHQHVRTADKRVKVVDTFRKTFSRADDQHNVTCVWRDVVNATTTRTASKTLTVKYRPRLFVSKDSITVNPGDNAILTCRVHSKPGVTQIRWMHEKYAVSSAGRFSVRRLGSLFVLTIERVRHPDAGTYVCGASNSVGRGQSKPLTLLVTHAPKFSLSDEYFLVPEGGQVSFICHVVANPPITEIKWIQIKTRKRPESFTPTRHVTVRTLHNAFGLTITDVRPDHAASYLCHAHNSEGHAHSKPVIVVIQYSPKISLPSASYSVSENKTVTLQCDVSAVPPAVITWTKDGVQLDTSSSRFTQEDSGGLKIDDLSRTDTGNYTCSAENSFGSAKSLPIMLDVRYFPKISLPSASYNVSENKTVTLQCDVSAVPPAVITWMKDGVQLDTSSSRFTQENSGTQGTLKIVNVKVKDGGIYVCSARNELGTTNSSRVKLYVRYPPKPSVSKEFIIVPQGGKVKIICSVDSNLPVTDIKWIQIQNQTASKTLNADGRVSIYTSGSDFVLSVNPVLLIDAAQYVCTATNGEGHAQSKPVTLDVKYSEELPSKSMAISVANSASNSAWIYSVIIMLIVIVSVILFGYYKKVYKQRQQIKATPLDMKMDTITEMPPVS